MQSSMVGFIIRAFVERGSNRNIFSIFMGRGKVYVYSTLPNLSVFTR